MSHAEAVQTHDGHSSASQGHPDGNPTIEAAREHINAIHDSFDKRDPYADANNRAMIRKLASEVDADMACAIVDELQRIYNEIWEDIYLRGDIRHKYLMTCAAMYRTRFIVAWNDLVLAGKQAYRL